MSRISPVDHAAASGRQQELLVGHVALNVLTNYFNKAFDVEVDFPVVEPQQYAAAA